MYNYDTQYQNLLGMLILLGDDKYDQTREVKTTSLFGEMLKVDTSENFPLLTLRKLPFYSIVKEALWFLKGQTYLRQLQGCPIWNEDSYNKYIRECDGELLEYEEYLKVAKLSVPTAYVTKKGKYELVGNCGPIYGKQWRNFNGVDQLVNAIQGLNRNFQSRQRIVSAWNPNDIPDMALPPCHVLFNLNGILRKNGDRELRLSYYMRSNDYYLGQPFNTASYALILRIIADMVKAIPTLVVAHLDDVHLYDNQLKFAQELCTRPVPKDKSELPVLNTDQKYKDLLRQYHKGDITISEFIDKLHYKMFSVDNYNPQSSLSVPMLSKRN